MNGMSLGVFCDEVALLVACQNTIESDKLIKTLGYESSTMHTNGKKSLILDSQLT